MTRSVDTIVLTNKGVTDEVEMKIGVRQADGLSSVIFSMALERVMRDAK